MTLHKQVVSGLFAITGWYYAYVVIRDFDSIVATNRVFFDLGDAWQANLATGVVTLVPLAFLAVAFAVYRDVKWWVAGAPALFAVIFTIGIFSILLGAYLVLYYGVLVRSGDPNGVGA